MGRNLLIRCTRSNKLQVHLFLGLFAIIVIYHNRYLHVGNQRLELGGELTDKGSIVVDGKVGNDIYGEQTVWLGIEEAMHLYNLFYGQRGLV